MADEPLPVDFRNNGTITLSVGGKKHTLRRPNFGELRRLWESWDERAGDQDILAIERKEQEAAAEGDRTPEGVRALRKVRSELREGRFDIWEPWVRDVFDTLSDQPLPEDRDEWEGFMLTATFAAQIVNHFQRVPLASG